jgi:hypothetical protein
MARVVKTSQLRKSESEKGRMTWWDFFNTAAGAVSLMGFIIAVVLGVVSWRSTRATNQLIARGDARTQEIRAQMDARAERMHGETLAVLERIDARA